MSFLLVQNKLYSWSKYTIVIDLHAEICNYVFCVCYECEEARACPYPTQHKGVVNLLVVHCFIEFVFGQPTDTEIEPSKSDFCVNLQ